MANVADPKAHDSATAPRTEGLIAMSLPYRDRAASTMFYSEVLGGELLQDGTTPKLRLGSLELTLGRQDGGVTDVDAEYPHYAFDVTPEQFAGLKHRLDAYKIPASSPWTREGHGTALMYFRDPAGNQWELYSKSGCTLLPLRIGARRGGDYVIDFPALAYDHAPKRPAADAMPPLARPNGFNHMTLAVRDLGETERFQTIVFNGRITQPGPGHLTVDIDGCAVGSHEPKRAWTPNEAEYPHFTLRVKPENLLPLKRRLESFGVVTHDIATHDGVDAWMYFRDPSSNLWELNCPEGFKGAVRRTPSAGGDFVVDVAALRYDRWKDPGAIAS
jgi:catechol 2,3-dioxygenase-like lactoylglutathione lyase family enzyme